MKEARPTLWDALPRSFDRLDRYLGRLFWSSYFVTFLFFFGFFMVLEFLNLADDLVEVTEEQGLPQRQVVEMVLAYYLYQAPNIFLQVSPFVTVIASIVMLARMKKNNEIVPILTSGRSVFRMMRPEFVFAATLMTLQILVQECLSPEVAGRRMVLRRFLSKGESTIAIDQPVPDQQGNQWLQLDYHPVHERIVSGQWMRMEDERLLVATLDHLRYEKSAGGWTREDGQPIAITAHRISSAADSRDEEGGALRVEERMVISSSLEPDDILMYAKEPFDLSFRELANLYGRSQIKRHLVLLHYHVTFPLSNLLLILLTAPFVLRFEKQSVLQGLAIAFFFCGAYYAADFTMQNLGDSTLHPVLAAWISPIFFGALGISMFDGIRS